MEDLELLLSLSSIRKTKVNVIKFNIEFFDKECTNFEFFSGTRGTSVFKNITSVSTQPKTIYRSLFYTLRDLNKFVKYLGTIMNGFTRVGTNLMFQSPLYDNEKINGLVLNARRGQISVVGSLSKLTNRYKINENFVRFWVKLLMNSSIGFWGMKINY